MRVLVTPGANGRQRTDSHGATTETQHRLISTGKARPAKERTAGGEGPGAGAGRAKGVKEEEITKARA